MKKRILRYHVHAGCIILIINYDDDACSWIVRKYKTVLFFWKKRTLSVWFNQEDQALKFAEGIKRKCEEESYLASSAS